jgi:peptidoglycan/LPS O-acetylase OafA/YrhL
MGSDRIHPLDSLRGIAALGVTMFWHYAHFGPLRPFDGIAADWLYRYGLMLVDFFFVLSGFVISHAYLRKLAEREVSPSQFFIARFSRLYPLHILTLLIVAALQFYRSSNGLGPFVYGANDLHHFLLNVAFLQQGIVSTEYSFNGPSWSLTVEELSYLMFFVSLYFFAGRHRLAFLVLLVLGVVINLAAWDTHVFNLNISRGLVGFFTGCMAYQLHRLVAARDRSKLLGMVAAPVMIVLIAYFSTAGYPRSGGLSLLVNSLLIFPAIVLTVLNVPILARLFSLRPIAYLGEISYSIYMIHFPVQLMLVTMDQVYLLGFLRGSLQFFFLYLTLTMVLSAASYHLFEKRAQAAIRNAWSLRANA